MSAIYAHADKALKRLYAMTASIFQRLSMMAKWDEVNAIASVKESYWQIDRYAFDQFKQIAHSAYRDAEKEIIEIAPEKKGDFKGIDGLFVMGLLTRYDPKTEYRYDNELDRKRMRAAESLISLMSVQGASSNSNEVRSALQRAMNLLNNQLREMADTVTDEAQRKAFDDAGVDEVMWNSQHDGRVCATCASRDGQVYPLWAVPRKHPKCRCYETPVIH